MVKSLIPIQRPRVRFPVAVNFLPASDKIVNLYLDVSDSFHSLLVIGCLAERLRRWTRNPLGNSCVGSNPAAVALTFWTRSVRTLILQISQYAHFCIEIDNLKAVELI